MKRPGLGGGRSWVYVFDKKRTYSSFVGLAKQSHIKTAQAGKAGAGVKKSAGLKKSGAKVKKSAIDRSGNPVASMDAAKQERTAPKSATGKTPRQSRKLANAAPVAQQQGKRSKNGNWEKKNGRWVYGGKGAKAQASVAKPARSATQNGLAQNRRAEKAGTKAGWVYRGNRWVYVAPSSQKKSATSTRALATVQKNTKSAAQKNQKTPRSLKVAKALSAPAMSAKSTESKAQKKSRPRRHGLAESHKATTSRSNVKVTRNQKSWVRRNNRWVYAKAAPPAGKGAIAIGQADGRNKAAQRRGAKRALQAPKASLSLQGSTRKNERSSQMEAGRMALKKSPAGGQGPLVLGSKPLPQNRVREFLFFIPGATPGSGSWFTAPVQMLRHAKKVRKPGTRSKQ